VTVSFLVAPENVGVAPITDPLVPCWMVMLWGSEDLLVKSIVTLPALAVSELLVNFSAPLGSAESLIELPAPPPPVPAAGVELEVDGAGAAADDVLLLVVPLEPPHAANPSARAAALRTRAEILGTWFPLGQDGCGGRAAPRSSSPRARQRSIKTLPQVAAYPGQRVSTVPIAASGIPNRS
jgi:hypothetical protein